MLNFGKTFFSVLNLRRVDGGVVYLNGKEIWRSNLPSGKVQYNTFATTGMGDKEWEPGSNCCDLEWLYYPCTNCTHGTASLLKVTFICFTFIRVKFVRKF